MSLGLRAKRELRKRLERKSKRNEGQKADKGRTKEMSVKQERISKNRTEKGVKKVESKSCMIVA